MKSGANSWRTYTTVRLKIVETFDKQSQRMDSKLQDSSLQTAIAWLEIKTVQMSDKDTVTQWVHTRYVIGTDSKHY